MKTNTNTTEAAIVALRDVGGITRATNAADLITAYTSYLANVTESTRETYGRALRPFFVFLDGRGTYARPTRADVVAYKQFLNDGIKAGKYSALTACSYLNAVRGFFAFTEEEGLYTNIAKGIKSPKHTTAHKKQHLEPGKVRDLLTYYQETGTPTALRDYAIVNLLIRTGLRTAELVGANVGDVAFIGSTRVLWIKGKGHTEKDAYVVLTEKAYAPLREYLNTRPLTQASDPLFISTSNHHGRQDGTGDLSARLTTRTIRNIARDGLDAIGLDDKAFTAHSLRHTTAVAILEAGGSLDDVQAQLRHASPTTSRIYVESFNRGRQLQKINSALDEVF